MTSHLYDMRYKEEQCGKYQAAMKILEGDKLGLVLDAGCGTGLLFSYIAERSELIVGVDLSLKTLYLAGKRAKLFRNVHLICADVDFLPIKHKAFNHVFAVTLIQNSSDPTMTVEECKRASKSDALVIVTGLRRVFSKDAFGRLVHDAGLRVLSMVDDENLACYIAACANVHHR